ATLLDVDLKQVPEVVEAGTRFTEQPLLLDARRLRVALRDDEAAKHVAHLARHRRPRRLAHEIAEADLPIGHRIIEEAPPGVVGHLDIVEMGPSFVVDADRSAQIDLIRLEAFGAHFTPPIEKPRLPRLERALELLVGAEVDVVRNSLGIDDAAHV